MTTDSIPQKHCSCCNQSYPRTTEYFHKDKTARDGLSYHCKECAKARARKWCADNKEYSNAQSREYHRLHPERAKQYARDHAEHIAEVKRIWRKNNPDKVKRHKADSQRRHRDSANRRSRNFIKRHPDRINLWVHRHNARKKELPFAFTIADWKHCLNYFNGCCVVCGRPAGLFHTIAKEHWIPMNFKGENPGTVPTNIVPMCHSIKGGTGGCNNQKRDMLPDEWLSVHFDAKTAAAIKQRVTDYFASLAGKTVL